MRILIKKLNLKVPLYKESLHNMRNGKNQAQSNEIAAFNKTTKVKIDNLSEIAPNLWPL